MSHLIRLCTDDDYPGFCAIYNSAHPDDVTQSTAPRTRFFDRAYSDPQYKHRRYAIEADGDVVGFGNAFRLISIYHPQKFMLNVVIHPDFQRRGFGALLYEFLLESIAEYNPIKLWMRTRDDMAASKQFIEKRGFVCDNVELESCLALQRFDAAVTAAAAEKMSAQGIRILDLAEFKKQTDWERRLYEIVIHVQADMPSSDPYTAMSLELYRKIALDTPHTIPEGYFLAADGDRLIGVSILERDLSDPKTLLTDDTGVHRDYRRRGIATALKLHALDWAKRTGYDQVRTFNEESNRAMLSINESLGFVKFPGWLGYACDLPESSA